MDKTKSNLLIITESFNFDGYKTRINEILKNLERHTKGVNFISSKNV